MSAVQPVKRTPAKRKARQLAANFRQERPDYAYLKEVFRRLRDELGIAVPRTPKRLPYVPTEEEIRRYYETVWKTRKPGDLVLIKTLLYTGLRVSELVGIKLGDVDFDRCQIRINKGKAASIAWCRFPSAFKETLTLHCDCLCQRGASYLFESSWKKPNQSTAELTQHGVIEAWITQFKAKQIFPIDASSHRICCLTIRQTFSELEHRNHRQSPRCLGRLSS